MLNVYGGHSQIIAYIDFQDSRTMYFPNRKCLVIFPPSHKGLVACFSQVTGVAQLIVCKFPSVHYKSELSQVLCASLYFWETILNQKYVGNHLTSPLNACVKVCM